MSKPGLLTAEDVIFWNPSIRKFKKVQATPSNFHDVVVNGLAYHYHYKILRIIFYPIFHQPNVKPKPAEAEIYTFCTDSWWKVVIFVESSSGSKPIESVHYESEDSCFVFLMEPYTV